MTRKKLREHLFVMLFRVDFHQKEELEEQISIYLDEIENASKKARTELRERFYAVVEHMEEIDKLIEEKAEGWALRRMAKADVTVLRLATYELLFDDQVPTGVAINEAVELSKLYGTDKSTSFINGVLATIAREQQKDSPDAVEGDRTAGQGEE